MNHGEIWMVDFSPTIGQEIGKVRPALIVSHNAIGRLRLKIVVPITDPTSTIQSWHVPIQRTAENGLSKDSMADCFQMKNISKDRFVGNSRIGMLSSDDMDSVKVALSIILDLV